MSEKDYVVPVNKPLKITQTAVFNMHDLYKHIRSWVDEHSYITFEKNYQDWTLKDGSKKASVKLATWKKVDDYTKYHLEIGIKFKDLTEVETKNGIMNKGTVIVKIESFLEKDYEDRWENSFMTRFIRSLYDYFILGDKVDTFKKELLDDSYDIYNEVKAFLGIHKIK